eukprot:CAMPEP_0117655938 /NCGR_PEP_ID=MMETSP0804-20121206/4540_1 /TAXON_ID=1074897 /ORGANISM="Tetraselmis astigmatica, Strain CCMP880" /LENGTH=196 /DNA_ID=CAMNT_0005462311 /DNA_START=11 /DNA_END=601 /DNA_ORIENTATION=-
MWQLSFPMDEAGARELSSRGPAALHAEALRRCGAWHDPIPGLLRATPLKLVSGYPVYDRELLTEEELRKGQAAAGAPPSRVTLIGDAAHPMSPFKGQGANQALLDAVLLARVLFLAFRAVPGDGHEDGEGRDMQDVSEDTLAGTLAGFEASMLSRSSAKVKASAEAAQFLHSDVAIAEGNFPRCTAANAAAVNREA